MKKTLKKWIGGLIILLAINTSYAQEKLVVFAAASLAEVMKELTAEYQKGNADITILSSLASSSTLARQIENGAQADIFISANQNWADYLIERKLAGTKETLLYNELVIITPKNYHIKPFSISSTTDWGIILPQNVFLSMGDPDHVPAGIYAKKALIELGVFDKLTPQMIKADNVRNALAFVELAEASLGIVYRTDALISNKAEIVASFPTDIIEPVEYPIVLINQRALNFYQYLKSPAAAKIFQAHGFTTP